MNSLVILFFFWYTNINKQILQIPQLLGVEWNWMDIELMDSIAQQWVCISLCNNRFCKPVSVQTSIGI